MDFFSRCTDGVPPSGIRFKDRLSYQLENILVIDLTMVKSGPARQSDGFTYELEIELLLNSFESDTKLQSALRELSSSIFNLQTEPQKWQEGMKYANHKIGNKNYAGK